MTGRPLPIDRSERFDAVRYRESLKTLGLFPPVARQDIKRAYRWRAGRCHPDRFRDETEQEEATVRVQEINAARDYALRHYRGFAVWQERIYRNGGDGDGSRRFPWSEVCLLPVTAVYGLATLLAGVAVALLGKVTGLSRRGRGTRSELGRLARVVSLLWLGLAPHGAVIALLPVVDDPLLEAWIGGTFLVMFATDVASVVTADPNPLRRHRALSAARSAAARLAHAA